MNNNLEAIASIQEIKQMMERSSKFLSLSGLAGIVTGIIALIGAAIAYNILNWGKVRFEGYGSIIYQPQEDFMLWLLLDGIGVLTLSILASLYFSKRKAKRLGVKMWDRVAKRMLINFMTPIVTGGIVTAILAFSYHLIFLIAPLTLIFYGLGLVSASKYTFDELRWLGYSEIILGILATLFLGYGLMFWVIGFGFLHIIYGIVMYKKHNS